MTLNLFVFLFCFVVKTLAGLDYLDSEIEMQCTQHCPMQNQTDIGHYDYACDYNCNIDQCAKGCRLWRKALTGPTCQEACNGTTGRLTPKELYCVMGCNDAIARYFSQLRVLLGVPPAPALVPDSLTATSLKLEWNFPMARKDGLSFHLQWKYEEFSASWQYCRNVTWADNMFVVKDLQPYTKYRFRIALILGYHDNHGEPIVSAPSVVVSTLPSGEPTSPPTNVRATPVDSTSISVSWEPGPFPHAPLLSYVLQITDNNSPEYFSDVKDIPPENPFYIIRNVKPLRNYTIQIRMKNSYGAGPPAATVISTPPERQVLIKDLEQPGLILGTDYSIFELTDILGEPVDLYRSKIELKSIGIHLSKELIFIVDSIGYVSRMPLKKNSMEKIHILKPQNLDFVPIDLTVDWLNDQLYILGKVKYQDSRYIIKRCNLDGSNLSMAYGSLGKMPLSLQIDPFSGYLFWTIQGYNGGGLYRLDIFDMNDNTKHEVKIRKLLNETDLGAFTIDYTYFTLLVSYQRRNTIMSVSLDGTVISDLRPSVTNAQLQKVISLATANKKFYWTDGIDVFNEEYHKAYDSYFHNTIPHLTNGSYRKIFIDLPSFQPWPVPIEPPTNIEVVFATNIAKIRWQAPHLLGIQGKGSWQNWTYEISVMDVTTKKVFSHNNIVKNNFTINNLKENTEYKLKVVAYAISGKGPWSKEFSGFTLTHSENTMILWSTAEGLKKSDAIADNVDTIIQRNDIKNLHFTDVSWFQDQLYLVANDSHIYWYNLTSQKIGQLQEVESVESIAVDWIGKKIYWSNPKQQLIIRSNFNGSQQEPLLTALARGINVDSIKAYMYWSTGIKIECAHLNGENKIEYHDVQFFSGKQRLTLDIDQKYAYWIVKGSDESVLYKAPMRGYWNDRKYSGEMVTSLKMPVMQGPLSYFHKRLLWLKDSKNAALSDLSGKHIATITEKGIWGLDMVHVIDSSLHILPDEIDPGTAINVIPEMLDITSIKVVGTSDSFNITWNAITNVNYGAVFYEVHIDRPSKSESTIQRTTSCSVKYWHHVAPFTPLNVTISALTYWGTSPQVRAELYSPSSTPSEPINLRTYVIFEPVSRDQENNVTILFRWDPPKNPNGLLQGFIVKCWYVENDEEIHISNNVITKSNETEYKLGNIEDKDVYYFQVQAFTEMGYGDTSDPISVKLDEERPLPILLIASTDLISIDDIDANETHTLLQSITSPIALTFLMRENYLYYINTKEELFMYNTKSNQLANIINIPAGTPKDLTIDWVERSLYVVTNKDVTESFVYKVDLNLVDKGLSNLNIELFYRPSIICSIEISPFTKKLYWIETTDNISYKLMQMETNGTEPEPFFSQYNNKNFDVGSKPCNCSIFPEIGPSFALDHSVLKTKPLIVFVDPYTLNVMSSDENGCFCNVIAEKSIINNSYPLHNIKSDMGTIYWTDPLKGLLHAFRKKESNILTKEMTVSDFSVFGQHMQPYPVEDCLSPKQYDNYTISLNSKSADKLILQMPDPEIPEGCGNFSVATIAYTVFYTIDSNASNCLTKVECGEVLSFNRNVELSGLKPYTEYFISVAISNYYSDKDKILVGPTSIFQTAPGVPSQPQNISAHIINPNLAKVNWFPPEKLNGFMVHYEIHWQTEGSPFGLRQKGEQPVTDIQSENDTILSTILQKLSPNETYTIWVRAYSETNTSYNESDKIQTTTYPEPASFILINRTAYSLKLSWEITEHINNYSVEYAPIISNKWNEIEVTEINNNVDINVSNLKPKMQYKFRLVILYENDTDLYVWPTDSRFTFETLGDRPSPPGIPIIHILKPNVYKAWWEASKENGAPIEMYRLEGKILISYRNKRSTNRTQPWFNTSPSIEITDPEWETFYNGTDTSWIIEGLDANSKYAFRVSALNSYGWSDPSEESNEFDLAEAAKLAEKENPMKLVLIAITVPISICVLLVTAFCYVICSGKRKQKNTGQMASISRTPDTELATLRELPRRGVHNTNILYAAAQQPPEEISLLPHINRDQISLTKFLGSGAFGEVFEGKAKGIRNNNEDTKVAIKTLKKGASDQEKNEFLQEAQLMSHFKHEHILQLLGVCLDNDPQFIIMELMQGGDLLTYLRESRNPLSNTPALSLIELLKMCVDVSKGCKYLEEMHFVHRDLACRNCLVSSIEPESRIVKIGDFGLARDIYKNDYYRKEGEGLLPVRWMSPESLVDGVFTSQSDVWAFGVLLWEIMTLGQQPYPARANLEVLHYVRKGGRLGKPTDCPENLYKLMMKCWEFPSEKRPTFKYCLNILENLHQEILENPSKRTHEGQYVCTVPEISAGISNAEYFRDENFNWAGNSWKNEPNENGLNKENTPFLLQEKNNSTRNVPKYLELVYEHESDTDNDGYEVPNKIVEDKNSTKEKNDFDSVNKNTNVKHYAKIQKAIGSESP